jgi:uncharacterized protein
MADGSDLPTLAAVPGSAEPFWRTKSLEEMTLPEWESLCDGCGLCCLVKLEDDETSSVYYTDVGCTLLDAGTCRCRSYETRNAIVPDCLRLTPEAVRRTRWLPRTCAYRLVKEGRDLYPWHPLRSGSASSVHEAGASARGRVAGPEEEFSEEELMDRIVDWPDEAPAEREPIGFLAGTGTKR